jgi:hypothetical protein
VQHEAGGFEESGIFLGVDGQLGGADGVRRPGCGA